MKHLLSIFIAILFLLILTERGLAQNEFITTWQTTDEQITIPTEGGGYNYDITWTNLDNTGVGDGSILGQTGEYTISGLTNGDNYQVEISGDFPRIYFNNTGDKDKIKTIEQWGNIAWNEMSLAFYGCSNLTYNATDAPNLSAVTSLYAMFRDCSSFNGDIGNWDVSTITDMRVMFNGASVFNQNISDWDVSNVTLMDFMFSGAESFNQPIGSWDVSNVTRMPSLFQDVTSFNQNLNDWVVSKVTDMSQMFWGASNFNQPLDKWDVSSLTSIRGMFREASAFNQDIGGWNITSATNMEILFSYATAFNQDLQNWDMSKVTNINGMFMGASQFDGDVTTWNTDSVIYMNNVFNGAKNFNQDISSWSVANVTEMLNMFNNATNFDQNLGNWDISNVPDMTNMFANSGLSTNNYDNTLTGWAAQTVQSGVTLGADGLHYCNGETARNTLMNDFGWTIIGDAKQCTPTAITISRNSINENNAIGEVIGTLSTTDPDPDDAHTYTLVAGEGDADNASFTIAGTDLQTAVVFDFETKSSYSIRVQTNDGNGGTYEEVFSIVVVDVNEAPVSLSLSANSIDENNTVGDIIGNFSTTDPDTDDTHTYALVAGDGDSDNASFTIDAGQLKSAEVFDYEVKLLYSIRVQTNDGNGGILESTFTVMIIDVDEVTNINQASGNTTINIYPNPAAEIIAVEHPGFDKAKKIYLLNVAGGVIKEQAAGKGKSSIRISEIPAGIYFIRIDSGKPHKTVIQ